MKLSKLHLPKFGIDMFYRENTTDQACITEVIEKKVYQLVKAGVVFQPGSQEGKLWLDLGANIGAFTKLIEWCGGYTYAFEPIEENFKILQKNMSDKSAGFQCAITTSEAEQLEFFTATKEKDKYRFTTIANSRPIGSMPNMCIKELMSNTDIFGIKMDIEGAEHDIIDQELIPPCEILVGEYHFSKDKGNMHNFRRRMDILKKHFELVHYTPALDKYEDKYPLSMDKMYYCVGRKKPKKQK